MFQRECTLEQDVVTEGKMLLLSCTPQRPNLFHIYTCALLSQDIQILEMRLTCIEYVTECSATFSHE